MTAQIKLELNKSHVAAEGYIAHLVVGDERIWIDRVLPTIIDADALHTRLAKEFSKCGVALVEDFIEENYAN